MALSNSEKKRFKTIGHDLKPVVIVAGNGLSEGVLGELERALNDHELVKIKLAIEDREDRKAIAEELCRRCSAELVQSIGKMLLIFRAANKPKLSTSNVRTYQS